MAAWCVLLMLALATLVAGAAEASELSSTSPSFEPSRGGMAPEWLELQPDGIILNVESELLSDVLRAAERYSGVRVKIRGDLAQREIRAEVVCSDWPCIYDALLTGFDFAQIFHGDGRLRRVVVMGLSSAARPGPSSAREAKIGLKSGEPAAAERNARPSAIEDVRDATGEPDEWEDQPPEALPFEAGQMAEGPPHSMSSEAAIRRAPLGAWRAAPMAPADLWRDGPPAERPESFEGEIEARLERDGPPVDPLARQ